MNKNRLTILYSLLFCLATVFGCAGKPPLSSENNNWQQREQIGAISQWSVKGRIGVKTADEGFTSNLNWQRLPNQQLFRIYGTLGQTYAELRQSGDIATLELSDKEIYESTDTEAMLRQVLGYSLPIEHLRYWILGIPYPGADSDLTFDKLGFLKTIDYRQWHISYKKYKRFDSFGEFYLPSKITVTDDEVTLRLSLRDWSTETEL